MTSELMTNREVQALIDRAAGQSQGNGDPRLQSIVQRIIGDLFATIDAFDISDDEFWLALNFIQAGAPEFGLWAPGLGFERFLDIRADAAAEITGAASGTPRTIEGPLYVPGAPRSLGEARLDDGTGEGEVLIMHGRVTDHTGNPIAGANVDVWHANTLGNYSYFDPSQSRYNLRRVIETDAEGRYCFRSIVPSGYSVPPGGTTERLLDAIGRHGHRPAHIHFFVSAPGFRHLTTQINIAGDPYLHDDFAYATRDELIPEVARQTDAAAIRARGLDEAYYEIVFDFVMPPARHPVEATLSSRPRVSAL
jgi:catechol 1,2-dioxygenase